MSECLSPFISFWELVFKTDCFWFVFRRYCVCKSELFKWTDNILNIKNKCFPLFWLLCWAVKPSAWHYKNLAVQLQWSCDVKIQMLLNLTRCITFTFTGWTHLVNRGLCKWHNSMSQAMSVPVYCDVNVQISWTYRPCIPTTYFRRAPNFIELYS